MAMPYSPGVRTVSVSPPMMAGCRLPRRCKIAITAVDQGSLQYEHAGAASAFILASWLAIAISTERERMVGWPEVRLGFCWQLRPTFAVSMACAGRNAVWSNLERRETLFHQFPRVFQPPRILQMPQIVLFARRKAIYPIHTTRVTSLSNTG